MITSFHFRFFIFMQSQKLEVEKVLYFHLRENGFSFPADSTKISLSAEQMHILG